MPRMRGSLNSLLCNSTVKVAPSQRVFWAQLAGMSILALHEMGILHRDIKSHNFLYDGGSSAFPYSPLTLFCLNPSTCPFVLLHTFVSPFPAGVDPSTCLHALAHNLFPVCLLVYSIQALSSHFTSSVLQRFAIYVLSATKMNTERHTAVLSFVFLLVKQHMSCIPTQGFSMHTRPTRQSLNPILPCALSFDFLGFCLLSERI